MKILFIIIVLVLGLILTFFTESVIRLLNDDRYIAPEQNRLGKRIFGIGLIIVGIWQLIEYLFSK